MRVKSPLALTAFLLSPFAVLGVIVLWIFISLRAPEDRTMVTPAVGAGARDTGGANALGEALAGRDPDAVQRSKRAIREGKLVHPGELPGGFVILADVPGEPELVEIEFLVKRAVFRRTQLTPDAEARGWTARFEPGEVPPGAAWRLVIDGERLEPAPLPLVTSDVAEAIMQPTVRIP